MQIVNGAMAVIYVCKMQMSVSIMAFIYVYGNEGILNDYYMCMQIPNGGFLKDGGMYMKE